MDKPLDLIVAKKDSLALVECLGTLGAETQDSLGLNRWLNDMKTQWRNMENTTKHHTEHGLLEMAVEKLVVRLAPVWQMMSNQKRSEALTQLNKPRDYEEMLKR
jgi:hypothetical protein